MTEDEYFLVTNLGKAIAARQALQTFNNFHMKKDKAGRLYRKAFVSLDDLVNELYKRTDLLDIPYSS